MPAMRARSSAGAWAASLAAHALVAVALWRLGGADPSSPLALAPPVEIEVDVDVDVAQPPEQAAAEPDVAPPSPRPAPAPRAPSRPAPSRSPAPSPPPSTPSPPISAAPPSPRSPSQLPSPSPGGGSASLPDLSFGALPDEVRARFAAAPPEAAIVARPSSRPGRPSVDELRVEVERAEDAVANVRAGRVDPLLYDYLRGAKDRFQGEAQRLADRLPVNAAAAARGWGRGYLGRVDQANRGQLGARDDAPREGGGDAPNEISPHADVLGAYDEARRAAEGGAEERRAEVCLDVAPGRDTVAVLRRGSGNARLDQLAVDSFAKAAAARPVPADARRGLACYELRLTAYRVPPLPAFSCSFDAKGVTCIWPFKKIASVKSRLLSVEYPVREGEASSLLRRPR